MGLPQVCLFSHDAVRHLNLPDEPDDLGQLRIGNIRHRRHVSKGPMMRAHAAARSHYKRHVAVVARLVDLVDERRRDSRLSFGIGAVAGGAVLHKRLLAGAGLGRQGGRYRHDGKRLAAFRQTRAIGAIRLGLAG